MQGRRALIMKKQYLDELPVTRDKIQISLTEQDFKALINGKIIATESAFIALQDIGFHRMQLAVTNAILQTKRSAND